jgi:hypothetical protein
MARMLGLGLQGSLFAGRPAPCTTSSVAFELRHVESGTLIRTYPTESAALAFVRDVVRVSGREEAAVFTLEERDQHGDTRTLASKAALVQRALEDRAE